MMINRSKNAVFYNHAWKYGVPLLRQMLPVLAGYSDSSARFGGIGNADAWSAKSNLIASPSSAGPTKRKDATAPPLRLQAPQRSRRLEGEGIVLAIVSITLSSCPLPAVLHNFWPTTKIND
jgi:hypothetical protein